MRTLLIESTPEAATEVAGSLDAAGHDVVRCHAADGPSFPCSGLTAEGCPIEAHGPIDVAIAVHAGAGPQPTAREAGATCAARSGIPLVVVGAGDDAPFDGWAETCDHPDELPGAVDRAIAGVAERRAAPLVAEAIRVLEVEGVDGGEVQVQIQREGDTAHIVVLTEHELPEVTANRVATRVHAVDQQGSWPTSKVGVAVGQRSSSAPA
jgi:hypothetical protein